MVTRHDTVAITHDPAYGECGEGEGAVERGEGGVPKKETGLAHRRGAVAVGSWGSGVSGRGAAAAPPRRARVTWRVSTARACGEMRPAVKCSCEFHTRDASNRLPVPVLFQPKELRDSFWLWLMSRTPMRVVAILADAAHTPHPRQFRGFLEAVTFVCQYYNLSVSKEELKELSMSGSVRVSRDGSLQKVTDAMLVDERYPLLPEDFGQSAICFGWKETSHHLMPPVARKHPRRAAPDLSPSRRRERSSRELSYPVETLGGQNEEVQRVVTMWPTWNAEVVHELLYWGAKPLLVEVNHTYRDRDVTRAVCTFAQPDGRLVRNVTVPVGVLKLEYPAHTGHLGA